MTTCITAEQRVVYTARLAEAEASYHSLMLGGQPRVFVDQNGERIEYTAANSRSLMAYITELKRLLGLRTVRGPMTAWL